MTSRRSSVRLLGNSTWNATAFLVGVGINLLILPFVVFQLGAATFGVAGLVTACIAPLLTLSNAIALSATREFAQRLDPHERDEARRLFATALSLAATAGALVAIILAIVGPPLARLAFNLVGEASQDLACAFAFGAGGWFCQCLATVFIALFTSRQDYPKLASISIISAIVSAIATLILIPRWPQASTYLGCQALGLVAGLLMSSALAWRLLGSWLSSPAFHSSAFGRLVHFGGWQFVAQAGGLIAGQADRYLLGAFLAPQFVGFYTIAQRLQEAVYSGILKIGEILFPFFSALQKTESSERVADLLFRSSWVLNILAVSALGALIPVAGPLLQVWTGAEVANEATRLLVTLCVAAILGCSGNVFAFFLLAHGRSRSIALISLLTAFFTLLTSAAVLPTLGWQAAGWSSCVGAVAQMITAMVLLRRSFDLADMWPRAAHFVLLPLLTGIAAALALRYLAGSQLAGLAPHWWIVGGCYGLAAGIIFVAVVTVSRIGPYGDACWHDLRLIAARFIPLWIS